MKDPIPGLAQRLQQLQRDEVVQRIWRGDHTVWKDDPTEITDPNRLGWLSVIDTMQPELGGLKQLRHDVLHEGFEAVVLLGMGGSSLAPEVLAQASPGALGLKLRVLDSTVPAEIIEVERSLDLSKTLFVVSSKSGTTIETTSQLAYFWDKLPHGRHFIAVTDAGTPLAALAEEREFRRVFLNPESVGGRYSALSFFGLVPAALVGVELEALLSNAAQMQADCDPSEIVSANPGALLGAVLGEAALMGRDKLTLLLPDASTGLGDWIEQLVAESTGKEGKGIIPVAGEPLGAPEVYGNDRLFVAYGSFEGLGLLEAAGHPVVHLPPPLASADLGAEFFRWEFATAVAGHVLAINPFDQPNVQEAKDAAMRMLERGSAPPDASPPLRELLDQVRPGDYVAIQAYLPRSPETRSRLANARLCLRDRWKVATSLGFGPRYLHSTGQVHKGGPNSGVFIQLVDESEADLAIPGRPFSFGQLMRAQALGDFEALRTKSRRVARTTLEKLEEVAR